MDELGKMWDRITKQKVKKFDLLEERQKINIKGLKYKKKCKK